MLGLVGVVAIRDKALFLETIGQMQCNVQCHMGCNG